MALAAEGAGRMFQVGQRSMTKSCSTAGPCSSGFSRVHYESA